MPQRQTEPFTESDAKSDAKPLVPCLEVLLTQAFEHTLAIERQVYELRVRLFESTDGLAAQFKALHSKEPVTGIPATLSGLASCLDSRTNDIQQALTEINERF